MYFSVKVISFIKKQKRKIKGKMKLNTTKLSAEVIKRFMWFLDERKQLMLFNRF